MVRREEKHRDAVWKLARTAFLVKDKDRKKQKRREKQKQEQKEQEEAKKQERKRKKKAQSKASASSASAAASAAYSSSPSSSSAASGSSSQSSRVDALIAGLRKQTRLNGRLFRSYGGARGVRMPISSLPSASWAIMRCARCESTSGSRAQRRASCLRMRRAISVRRAQPCTPACCHFLFPVLVLTEAVKFKLTNMQIFGGTRRQRKLKVRVVSGLGEVSGVR